MLLRVQITELLCSYSFKKLNHLTGGLRQQGSKSLRSHRFKKLCHPRGGTALSLNCFAFLNWRSDATRLGGLRQRDSESLRSHRFKNLCHPTGWARQVGRDRLGAFIPSLLSLAALRGMLKSIRDFALSESGCQITEHANTISRNDLIGIHFTLTGRLMKWRLMCHLVSFCNRCPSQGPLPRLRPR